MIFSFKKIAIVASALTMLAMPALAAPEIGKTAPSFKAKDVYGNVVTLDDYKGHMLVLEWSNHECPFVTKHYDSGNMQEIQKRAHTDGIRWIKVLSSAPGRQGHVTDNEALEIANKDGSTITTIIRDEDGVIGKAYGARTTPHMFIIDKDSHLVYMGAIDSNSSPRQSTIDSAKNYVISVFDALESGNAINPTETQPYGCGVKY